MDLLNISWRAVFLHCNIDCRKYNFFPEHICIVRELTNVDMNYESPISDVQWSRKIFFLVNSVCHRWGCFYLLHVYCLKTFSWKLEVMPPWQRDMTYMSVCKLSKPKVIMTSLCSIAAPNCRTCQSKGRYCKRECLILLILIDALHCFNSGKIAFITKLLFCCMLFFVKLLLCCTLFFEVCFLKVYIS